MWTVILPGLDHFDKPQFGKKNKNCLNLISFMRNKAKTEGISANPKQLRFNNILQQFLKKVYKPSHCWWFCISVYISMVSIESAGLTFQCKTYNNVKIYKNVFEWIRKKWLRLESLRASTIHFGFGSRAQLSTHSSRKINTSFPISVYFKRSEPFL